MRRLKGLITLLMVSFVLNACANSPIIETETDPNDQKPTLVVPTSETEPSDDNQNPLQTEMSLEPSNNAPDADRDLTHLLSENNLVPRYGTPNLHLLPGDQLLVWFDSAALFDLNSEMLMGKTEITTEIINQKTDFAANGVGMFTYDFTCPDCSILLDRYDYGLNWINTLDLSQIFNLRNDINRPMTCALSNDGNQVACAKSETRQILVHDLQAGDQRNVVSFTEDGYSTFRAFESLTFAGSDRYLAFTTQEESGSSYGLIRLEDNQVVDYSKWDTVAENIQTTDQAVFFHEMYKGPWYPASNQMIRVDLDTLDKQEIQFSNEEESFYVTVSQTGRYIVTVHDISNTSDYVVGSIRIYDGDLTLLRQIDLERGFPTVFVIDETNRFLIGYYFDEIPKLAKYGF